MCWNSPLPSKRRVWAKGNSPTTEGVDATPTAWDVEQFESAKHRGNGRINEKVVASGLQAKYCAQQQERRSAGPGLWATRGGVFHRELRQLTGIAGERLRQATLEVAGRLKHAHGDSCCLLTITVAPEPHGDKGVVVWPDRPEMIANRVVAPLAFRHGADAPPRIQLRTHQVVHNSLLVATAVLDIAIAIAVPVCVDPGERSPGFHLQLPYQCNVAGPALNLIEQDQEERRGVGSSIGG